MIPAAASLRIRYTLVAKVFFLFLGRGGIHLAS